MNIADIRNFRLANEHLTHPDFATPEAVVAHLGAVQSQDYPAARWGLGIRMKHATDVHIDEAYNAGKFLRLHVMRPTWHFVMPEDVRWMQALTSANVKKLMGHYNRKLELTEEVFVRSAEIISHALIGGTYLTRQEIKKLLEAVGIKTDVQRLAHLLMDAELDALICNGPRRGKQFTYALLDERVAKTKELSREESLAKLALKYFSSHGPAQIKDFAWWSGLSIKDATVGLDSTKKHLEEVLVDGKTYWLSARTQAATAHTPTAYLLSIFDEYTIAYKDRSALSEQRDIERMISMGNALLAVIILDGKVLGSWKRVLKKNSVEITLKPFRELKKKEKEAVLEASEKYGAFLEMKSEIIFS